MLGTQCQPFCCCVLIQCCKANYRKKNISKMLPIDLKQIPQLNLVAYQRQKVWTVPESFSGVCGSRGFIVSLYTVLLLWCEYFIFVYIWFIKLSLSLGRVFVKPHSSVASWQKYLVTTWSLLFFISSYLFVNVQIITFN